MLMAYAKSALSVSFQNHFPLIASVQLWCSLQLSHAWRLPVYVCARKAAATTPQLYANQRVAYERVRTPCSILPESVRCDTVSEHAKALVMFV